MMRSRVQASRQRRRRNEANTSHRLARIQTIHFLARISFVYCDVSTWPGFNRISAVGLIENNKPARYFTIYDGTGLYAEDIDRELERQFLRGAISAWDLYATLSVKEGEEAEELLPAPFAPVDLDAERLEAFEQAGGFAAARVAISPYLRAGAPAFVEPKRQFRRVPLPPEAEGASDITGAELALRPYLLDEKAIRHPEDRRPLAFCCGFDSKKLWAQGGRRRRAILEPQSYRHVARVCSIRVAQCSVAALKV